MKPILSGPTRILRPRPSLATLILALGGMLLLGLAPSGAAAYASPDPEPAVSAEPDLEPRRSSAFQGGRLVILGFDGADGSTVEGLLAEGQLPNLSRLGQAGTFSHLGIEFPPESPVSWACLNTGQNPAKTGIPGFVRRELRDGKPSPNFGHLEPQRIAVEEFENTPLPTWSPLVLGLVLGLTTALVFFFVLKVLLRLRAMPSLLLALLLGAVGGVGGYKLRGYLPGEVPRWGNPNQARNFWDYAADEGVECTVLEAAQAFDMPAPEGARVLAGLGVPDARGGIGDWFIYTTEDLEFDRVPKGRGTGTAGTVYRVDERDGKIQTKLYGPQNFWAQERLKAEISELSELRAKATQYRESIELEDAKQAVQKELAEFDAGIALDLVVEKGDGSARIRIGDEEQEVAEGRWSDFYHLTFELNPLLKVHAVTRVKLVHLDDPHFELFVNTIDIDPAAPPFWQAISSPFDFSADLAQACGAYETYGWATATMPFKDGEISPETLLEDVEFTMQWRERLTYEALERGDWQGLFSVFSTIDRVQHMLYQFYDESHPMYDAQAASRETTFFGERIQLRDAIPAAYRQLDRIVGVVMDEHLDAGDTLIVCSDHGFQSFRRQVHVNNWLAENGYLALKTEPPLSRSSGSLLRFVDWGKTQAYSLGLGFVYLNLAGREADGIVQPEEADELLERIRADFLASVDPASGLNVCTAAYITSQEHEGPYLGKEADMILGFANGYRVSWRTTQGGAMLTENEGGETVLASTYEDNTSNWSGGHVSMDTDVVSGIFFSNRRVALPPEGVHLLHVAPTALAVLGVPIPVEMDLAPLEFRN